MMRYGQIFLLAACLVAAPLWATAQFPPLKAVVTADPQTLEGEAPLAVSFDAASSTGGIIKYEWMFGDGAAYSGSTVTHTFAAAGLYDVTLKVTDDLGATDQETVTVAVARPAIPIAALAADRDLTFTWLPNPESVDGYKIYYKTGSASPPYVGTGAAEGPSPVATGNVTSFTLHGLSTSATYYFTITAYIGPEESDYAPEVVVLPVGTSSTPPTAVISSSATVGNVPLQVQFDGSSSSDSDGTIVSYQWDLGDGGTATGSQVTYTYNSAGTFTARLTVTDDTGLTSSVSTPVLVSEPPPGEASLPPVAVISAASNRGLAPFTVLFDAKGSYDPDGKITGYTWNFGDGSTGTGLAVRHSYPVAGNYAITLKVIDNTGAVSPTVSYRITVLEDGTGTTPVLPVPSLPFINILLLNAPENKK